MFSLNSHEKYTFFQKNVVDNKSASPVIRSGSYNNKPAFNDWDSTNHFNNCRFYLFTHKILSKTCKQTHRKTQLYRLRFHHKKYNLTKDNYIVYVLRAIPTCVYCKSNIFEKITSLERQINSQLQLRSLIYNLVAGHPGLGIIT